MTSLSQEEDKLLAAVEESLSKVLELKNRLSVKKTQVSDSKAELDQKTKSLQGSSR